MSNIKKLITVRLADIEKEEDVSILYACESGSRAWGFASRDSDWDVRFIYLRPRDWYLTIDVERKRDVIERMEGDLDLSGWDLRKALWLFRKSNPPLLEWLSSPIIYADRLGLATRLQAMAAEFFSPTAGFHHYLHMARGNFRGYLQGETVKTKKYLYVLRPLLALRWIEIQATPPPMRFAALVETLLPEDRVKEAVHDLLARKMAGAELAEGPKISAINEFLEQELARLETEKIRKGKAPKPSLEPLNQLFREMLNEVEKLQ